MPASRCRYCKHPIKLPVCAFCGADQRLPIPEATLPANEPRRFDVSLEYPPREMFGFHIEGITVATKDRYSHPHVGKPWTWDLIAVPMETVRKTFEFKRVETPRARENLQIWVNNLGPALYNPITWRLQEFYKARKPSPGGLLRKGLYIRQYDGMHRLRALEALDFNFVYLLLAFGFPTQTGEQRAKTALLFRPAIRYHLPNYKKCTRCKGPIRWIVDQDAREKSYKCIRCGDIRVQALVYPEPV